MIYVYATLITLIMGTMLHISRNGLKLVVPISPDGQQYMAAGGGEAVPVPYSLRWLLPTFLKNSVARWVFTSWFFDVAMGPLAAWYIDGDNTTKLFGVALLAGLPGVLRVNVVLPVLTDGAAITSMLLSLAALRHKMVWLGLGTALVSGALRETTPIFIAANARSYWPLIGLLPILIRYLQVRKRDAKYAAARFTEKGQEFLDNHLPGLNGHRGQWLSAQAMLLPWGVCLLAAWYPNRWMGLSLALSYGQLILAMDKARLYQWAFPAILDAVVGRVPRRWMIPAILTHWFHPWNTSIL